MDGSKGNFANRQGKHILTLKLLKRVLTYFRLVPDLWQLDFYAEQIALLGAMAVLCAKAFQEN